MRMEVGEIATDAPTQFKASDVGHVPIRDHESGFVACKESEGFAAILGKQQVVQFSREAMLDGFPRDGGIIDGQNLYARRRKTHISPKCCGTLCGLPMRTLSF